MATLKDKIAILKSLESNPFDQTRITEYLSYAIVPDMTCPILKRLLSYLIECDCQISALFELISDESWANLVSDRPSATDENFDLRTKIDCLAMHFNSVYEILDNNEISLALNVLSALFEVKTRNIQFLIFILAKKHLKQVFAFLLTKMKKLPTVYTPFFCSLLVRLKFDAELKAKCFQAFQRHLLSKSPSKNIQYLVLLQSYMYVICFKGFEIDEESLKHIKKAYSFFGLLNKDVVLKFMEIPIIANLKLKDPVFHSLANTCFYFFPFDLPIIPQIKARVESDFVNFE